MHFAYQHALARQDCSEKDLTFLQICHCNLWLFKLPEIPSNLGKIPPLKGLLVSVSMFSVSMYMWQNEDVHNHIVYIVIIIELLNSIHGILLCFSNTIDCLVSQLFCKE